jgi:hypothetical protein
MGIMTIDDSRNKINCNVGNWTETNITNTYLCGEEKNKCSFTYGYMCVPYTSNSEMPSRFKNKVDKCTYFNIDLKKDESREIILDVSTYDFKNSLDYLEIVFFGEEQKHTGGKFEYLNELNGNPVGMNDTKVRIEWKSN